MDAAKRALESRAYQAAASELAYQIGVPAGLINGLLNSWLYALANGTDLRGPLEAPGDPEAWRTIFSPAQMRAIGVRARQLVGAEIQAAEAAPAPAEPTPERLARRAARKARSEAQRARLARTGPTP